MISALNDDNGIIWPRELAPYHVLIVPIKYEGQVQQTCQQIAEQLEAVGMEVLIDDRIERPGVKFKDADLIGIPLRITIGDKGLADGIIEIKSRDGAVDEKIAPDAVAQRVTQLRGL